MGASPPPLCAPSSSFFPSLARPPLLAVSPLPCWPPWALRVLWRCEGVGSSPLRWSLPWCVFYKLTLLAAILSAVAATTAAGGRRRPLFRSNQFPLLLLCVCVCSCASAAAAPVLAARRCARAPATPHAPCTVWSSACSSLSCLLAFTTVPPLLRAGPTVLCCIHPQHTHPSRASTASSSPLDTRRTQHNTTLTRSLPAFLLLLRLLFNHHRPLACCDSLCGTNNK